MNNDNPGWEITIYAHLNEMLGVTHSKNIAACQEVLQAIETQLGNANIRPNGLTLSDRQITGSCYISYRNDLAANGTYISAEQANGNHNPGNHPDNYQHIQLIPGANLNLPNQGGAQLRS